MNVSGCHFLHQGQAHRALGPALRQERSPGSFRLPAIQTPEVRVPRRRETERSSHNWVADRIGSTCDVAQCRRIHAQAGPPNAQGRELLRPGDLYLRLLFQDALRRNPEIVIVAERLAYQFLQLRFAKHLRPLFIAE